MEKRMSTQQRAAGNACPTAAFSFDPARLAQRRRWAGAFAALCGLALSPSALLAEEHSQYQDHAVELAPSVVTGVAQSSPLTIVTNPKEPRQPVPASDGADYLKTIPGFAVIRNGGSNGDPVLRGMFGSRLNILTNGGMMLGACPNRMDAPTSYISPETYDKLTVIKGPQTVLWGPGASAGTILFEREPERFGELGSRVNASLLAGSNGRFDKVLDAAAGNRLGYLRFTGNHAQSDDYEDGAGNTVPSRWKKWNGDVAVGWTPDEDTLIELTAGKGDGEALYAGRGMDGSQFKRESLGLRFVKSNVSDVLEKVEAQVYYNYADHIMDNFRLRTPDPSSMMPMPMASQVDRRTLGGRLAATWRWDDFKLVTGVDAMRNEHRARGSKYDMMTDYYTDADQFPWSKDAVFHNYGAFGELTWFAAERDRLIGGLRLDRASVKDYRQTLKSGHMGHAMANPTANDTRADTLPSGFVRYEHDLADSPTTLYAGLGHAERLPDYWELFSPKRGPNGSVNAFDKIKPEKTTQLDFGLQYNGDKLQAWASGYVGVVQDFILFSYREGMMGSSTQATNVDARIMGGELGASYQLTGNWKTDASLAYAWGKNSSDDRALPQIPPLEARFGLTYEEGDWSAGSLWRVVAPQSRIARDQGNVVGKDFDKSAGFGVFSLNGAYRVTRNVKLSAGVDNLFDKDYTEHLNKAGDAGFGFSANETVPEPGRTFWTKVDFSF
ncbi:TPA: TonB-dependent copper receptor [Pseudomonas aeruginosa]|uniref:TonB-dependent copper receptor n=1 Tax=Pseudomonas aeruginosa TaxID=287 RepID=UPI001A3150CF|nr:TonB-dependent copper receptor [Pseudomonas aeruginosa]MBI7434816.1 TonB-dependent copper receptor [Pseudomonas aeruginosa]MDN3880216.1 TonB-dependent copper receptor [Pseudomonas aeruginosa]MDN3887526.1 TonB-dependent copper receptor [Pseudomonas aeruginosa]HCP6191904.1 TonB-dependent copper receptor [Pseudomonas aeruginosa]HCP6265202.1 TonB-dependent copper receptor [Pseudomonas aeruginosa]